MRFTFDPKKRGAVWDKHGVDLLYLARMFEDPSSMEVWDDPRNPGRKIAIGRVEEYWYELAFQEKTGEVRLITGWKLDPKSREKARKRHSRRTQGDAGTRRDQTPA